MMSRKSDRGKKLPAAQWSELVEKMQGSDWDHDCAELCFVVAKLFDVNPWQVGALGFFHDADDWLGAGWLAWAPLGMGTFANQSLYDDCEVIVATKEGKEVARKKVADFTFEELLRYSISHLWILAEQDVESRYSWKFSDKDLRDLGTQITKAGWTWSDEEVETFRADARFDDEGGSVGPLRPAVATHVAGKYSLPYLAVQFVSEPLESDSVFLINSGDVFYVLDSVKRLIDTLRPPELTIDKVRQYASGYVWVSAADAGKERLAAYDAEVAATKRGRP